MSLPLSSIMLLGCGMLVLGCISNSDLQTRSLTGWENRAYDLYVPTDYDGTQPLPLVVMIHGGAGNKEGGRRVTCPGGDLQDSGCLTAIADREGFFVAFPNGTPGAVLTEVRTFNAGGGTGGYACVSGQACSSDVDDLAYFSDLLDDVEAAVEVDADRIYVMGLSNGGAMSHRLACELSERIAAIGAVSGGNQLATTATCSPSRPIPIFEIHGIADPCWPYNGGSETCSSLADQGTYASIPQTVADWVTRNGCNPTATTEDLPDQDPDDGTTVTVDTYSGCDANADVVLYQIVGGGHPWPGGYTPQSESTVGTLSQEINASEVLWSFFSN